MVCTTKTKTVSGDLFFHPLPEIPADKDPDAAAEAILATDFKTGHFVCEHIIQRSVIPSWRTY